MTSVNPADVVTKSRPLLGDLSRIVFRTQYRTPGDDIAEAFYRPCLASASLYKRAVGYFRSSVYTVVGDAVVDFARRGGTILLICSPDLSDADIEAVNHGYASRDEVVARRIAADLKLLADDDKTAYPITVLATLVAHRALDIRLALRADLRGIYHEKIGVFVDRLGNRVSFMGSANETGAAWSSHGNVESIEVFCDWRGGLEQLRVANHESIFDNLWADLDPHIRVFSLPAASIHGLRAIALDSLDSIDTSGLLSSVTSRRVLPHQTAAIAGWDAQDRRGIFEHATGTGKTFTALLAIRRHVAQGLPAIVLVPSLLLLQQWESEIRQEVPGAHVLLAGAGNNDWKNPALLRAMTDPDPSLGPRVTLATMKTAASQRFLANVVPGSHLLVVADEVHQIGSPHYSRFLTVDAGSRLGLSATPTRYSDPDGTACILEWFGSVVEPRISIADGIAAGRLVPYDYHPHPVHLTPDEAADWRKLTFEIRKEMARSADDEAGNRRISERAKHLLIKRSRIAKKAAAKVPLAVAIVMAHYREGEYWFVYCEDQEQLGEVVDHLRLAGLSPLQYHTAMNGDPAATMHWFKTYGGLLVAIRCLDEGVDIPAVTHAVILASSQNPRQFIQRRGRVLRKHTGKTHAVIHDAIVVPVNLEEEPEQVSLLKSELVRSIEFATHARNATAAADIRSIAIDLGIDPDKLINDAIEEDEEDERA